MKKYVYKNEVGRPVNIGGYQFADSQELLSEIVIDRFKEAVSNGFLSLKEIEAVPETSPVIDPGEEARKTAEAEIARKAEEDRLAAEAEQARLAEEEARAKAKEVRKAEKLAKQAEEARLAEEAKKAEEARAAEEEAGKTAEAEDINAPAAGKDLVAI